MNPGTFRPCVTSVKAKLHALISLLLLCAIVAESLAPVAVWATPPLPRADAPMDVEAAPGALHQQGTLDLTAIPDTGAPAVDKQNLPAEVDALTEVMARRSVHSATYAKGDKHFETVLSAAPLHYRDADGNWQPIDVAFRTLDDSFVVEHNLLTSRAGLEKAWVSAAADKTAIRWEATSLAATTADGKRALLATALDDPAHAATRTVDGNVLHYAAAWSDPTLREELHSTAGSLEQVLVLGAPPTLPASFGAQTPEYLEMQADLQLLPGSTLWADGIERTAAFTTQGALEIHQRDGNGEAVLVIDPVVAFEADQRFISVAGEYVLTPGDEADHWSVGVRTPWQWWVDDARTYPAILDPTIRVNRTTGYGDGTAWIGTNDQWNYGGIVLGPFDGANSDAEGYVQFNSFPGLLSEAPVQIKQAYLDIEPAGINMPYYKHPKGDYPDWEHKKIQRNTEVFYVGACPTDASCNGFALQQNAPTNTWGNRPSGQPLAAGAQKALVAGPAKGGGSTTITTWDVTQELATWYAQDYTDSNYPKPTFRIRFKDACTVAGPYEDDKSAHIPRCSSFHMPTGNVRLRIEYEELPITIGQSLLNLPGVPGYQDGVLEDTAHQYDLAISAGFSHWRGVAVRGNHDTAPAPTTRAGIRIVDETGSEPEQLTSASTASAEETAFVLLDDHNAASYIATADLKALVTASNENDLPTDPERNYRINYVQAQEHSVPIGDWHKVHVGMDSSNLLDLHEMYFDYGDKVAVRAVISPAVDIVLVEPTAGNQKMDGAVGNNDSRVNRGFQPSDMMTRTLNLSIPRSGVWALGVVNQTPPIKLSEGEDPDEGFYYGYVEILRCPVGTIPTDKWKCQPLRLPDDTTPDSKTVNGVTIYSEGGFISRAGGGASWCTHNEGSGAPIIGPAQNDRWAFVGQGSICYTAGTQELYTTADSSVGLAVPIPTTPSTDRRGDYAPGFVFGDTSFSPLPDGFPTGETLIANGRVDVKDDQTRINVRPFHEYWEEEWTGGPPYIDLVTMITRGEGTLNTQLSLGSDQAPFDRSFDTDWAYYPHPYQPPQPTGPLYFFSTQIAQNQALPIPLDVASLAVRILQDGNDAPDGRIKVLDSYLKASAPSAGNLHADRARVTQDAQMGGATKPAQIIVQPPGLARQPDNEKSCSWQGTSTSCIDLRVPEYKWANGDGEKNVARWAMPDIHLTGDMSTMMVSSAGQLSIFSTDHPQATQVSQSFSFDTWDADVSVTQEPCDEGGPETVVVRGQALIALPSVGDNGGAPPSIEVAFKLCETELRQAKLTFAIPAPGIPVGSTGVGVNLIGGTVTVGPQSVQITIEVGFQTMDGSTVKNGKGSVTIDTAGLFALEASAKIVSVLDAQLTLQIAWNPLDLLFEAEVGYKNLIEGGLRMHAWVGQGWQGKYSWLPDNNDFHFTGMIWATLNIEQGMIVDEGIFQLPPFSFSLTITISFGEFCTNSTCTTYDWGMSATITVMGYGVGVYVDSSGPELILGSDNHKLIDQFGGNVAQVAASQPVMNQAIPPNTQIIQPGWVQQYLTPIIDTPVDNWPHEDASTACGGTNTTVHTCAFTIDPGTGRALFTASWENGNLDVVVVKPDNSVINASTAISNGAVYSSTSTSLLHQASYAVTAPAGQSLMPGQWSLQLSNVGIGLQPGFDNNYQLLFASDPPAPNINWNEPANPGVMPDGSGMVNLQWNVTRGGQPLSSDLNMELFYAPLASKPMTPTEMAGNIIVNGLSANQGTYAWDTRGLASGEYAVGARVDDRLQANGHIVAWAPGSIVVNDITPPPVPHILGNLPVDDGLIVAWQRDDTTPDLAGYLVEYGIPDWNFNAPHLPYTRRVNPSSKFVFPFMERVRLNGLINGQPTTVCVRSLDASGNESGCEEFTVTIRPTGCRLGELTGLNAYRTGKGMATINWDTVDCGEPDGYLVNFRPIGCFVPGLDRSTEDPKPVLVVDDPGQFEQKVKGLIDYQSYWVGVRAYANTGDLSPERSTILRMIDPTDADSDGLPDGWAELYGVSNANDDDDKDGLNNGREFDLGSNPLVADSDEDGFYDGEEDDWGTDLCGPETPPYHRQPRLRVHGLSELSFHVATNQSSTFKHSLGIFNDGSEGLQWTIDGSESWLEIAPLDGVGPGPVEIGVNMANMPPGVYTAMVEIHNSPPETADFNGPDAVTAVDETVNIPVRVEVLPAKMEESSSTHLLLPIIMR